MPTKMPLVVEHVNCILNGSTVIEQRRTFARAPRNNDNGASNGGDDIRAVVLTM